MGATCRRWLLGGLWALTAAQVAWAEGETPEAPTQPPATVVSLWFGPARPELSGEINGGLSYNRQVYASHEYWARADLVWRLGRDEFSGRGELKRESARRADGQVQLTEERYDVYAKYRRFDEVGRYFVYVSPRLRHNAFGYYRSTRALRGGVGYRQEVSDDSILLFEAGLGTREARTADDAYVRESLQTFSAQWRTQFRSGVKLAIEFVNERGQGERYRTLDLSVRSRLSDNFGIKYSLGYGQTFPIDALSSDSEANANISLSYEL